MDQRQYEAMLADAEIRLKRLRMLYDQWFIGVERSPPQKQKDEIEALIADLKLKQPRNTALRFRLNQLVQRHVTYSTYWQRVARQIEEGTYKRDVLRARRRFGLQKPAEGQASKRDAYDLELDVDVDVDIDAALAALKSEPPPADAANAAAPPARNGSSAPPPRRDSDRALRAHREITPFALPTPPPPPPAGAVDSLVIPGAPAPAGQASLRSKVAPPPPPGAPRRPPPPPLPPGASARPPPPAPVVSAKPHGPVVAAKPPAPVISAKPQPPVAARPAGAATGGTNLSDEQMLNLYQRYVSARRDNKERTDNVRLETVAKTVRDMLPKLKEKHAGKQIDFEVVVKDGRVALKPVPK